MRQMKVTSKVFAIVLLIGVVLGSIGFMSSTALASEKKVLYVCKYCSADFIEVAKRVIQELGLEDKVIIKKSGCLKNCDPPVVKFEGKVYTKMTEEKLKNLLKEAFGL